AYVESHNQLPEHEQLADLANTLKVGQSGYLYLLSPEGVHLYHPFLQGQDRSQIAHIQRQLELKEGISQYYHANPHEAGLRAKVAYSRKLPSGNTLVASTYKDELMFLVDQVQLKEKLSKYAYGESGYIYIVDLHGQRILQNKFDNRAFDSVVESTSKSFIEQVLNKREGHVKFDLQNESGVATKNIFYKFYPYLNWVIVAGISEQELKKNHSLLFVSLLALFV
ncbi:Cache 3/Cache 2 fusion domain-containing protein, partial [Vibrio sp. D173a]|uniref:Cache 3/Cache 2 fusion domain-containing protein n=1 Tax=Vibrio sp. D173a TaxID=2836349 RepID=UPI002557797A